MTELTDLTMFEQATRNRLRWTPSTGGSWDIEFLWQADEVELHNIYIKLGRSLEKFNGEGLLVSKVSSKVSSIELKMAIVKRIFEVKKAEKKQALLKKLNKDQLDKVLSVIAQKEANSLLEMSKEDLLKLVEGLEV